MKKSIISFLVLAFTSINLSAGVWDSISDAYNKIKDDVKNAGNSVDYYKKCDDKKNIEYFQKENTHLHEYLYVASVRGTNVKKEPSSKSKTICTLPLNFPVRLLKVDKKETINNAESYWIKVIIPDFINEKYNCGEYGYIFGNYLSHEITNLKEISSNWNKDSLRDLLQCGIWVGNNKKYFFCSDGTYTKIEKGTTFEGIWSSEKDGRIVTIDKKDVTVQIKDAWTISIGNELYERKFDNELIYYAGSDYAFYYSDINGMNGFEFHAAISIGNTISNDHIIERALTADKLLNKDQIEAYFRKNKGEIRTYHFETVKINDSDKKLGMADAWEIGSYDLDNDNQNESIMYNLNNDKLTFFIQKKDYYYELKSKNSIEAPDGMIQINNNVAYELESPVPYILIERKFADKTTVEFYTIKGTELKLITKVEQAKTTKDLCAQYYFDSDNFYINFYDLTDLGTLNFAAGYVLEQNVNDIYSFTQKKLKIKK